MSGPLPAGKPAFERIVDLGEFSGGKQVFRGESAEELIDALAQAQRFATAKIRAQAKEIKKLQLLLRANWYGSGGS
jgi:hypothetical protein